MKMPFYLLAVSLFISFLTGCEDSSKKPWKDIKATELISHQQLPQSKTITVDLLVYLFRVPADKLTDINEQISETNELSVKYTDSAAFSANGLVCCAGDRNSWQKIAPLLAKLQQRVKKHINIIKNIPDDIIISESAKPVSVTYRWDSATAGIGFDAGRMVLRIKVEPLLGLRQACRLEITPIYITGAARKTKKQIISSNNYEFAFESAGASARLGPGQFILLAPAQVQTDQSVIQTLSNLMFYQPPPPNTADLCLIACSSINTP
jgi:hypothetical protein